MSRVVKKTEIKPLIPSVKLGVRDTDFLLRLIKRSSFSGNEIEQCHDTMRKLSEMHSVNLEG